MLKFYFNLSPNPTKVALYLEEAGLDYDPIPVDARKGDQHKPHYRLINPNGKVPALVDGDVTVFDSNAILLYLAEKTGKFLPDQSPASRGDMLSWLMFVATGLGPFSGQAVHFTLYAPDSPYATNRYQVEAMRHYRVLNDRLANHRYVLGSDYTFIDMSVWGWTRLIPQIFGDNALDDLRHLKRLIDEISDRPAAKRALDLKNRHNFKTEMDEAARRQMFPQNYEKNASG